MPGQVDVDSHFMHGIQELLLKSRILPEVTLDSHKVPEASKREALEAHVTKLRQLDKAPADEGAAPVPVCAVPNFVEEAELLSWAGVGFGEVESYKIMCSLRNLAAKEKDAGLSKLRFWGKVLGTDADYYVAEAQREGGGGGDEEPDPDAEPSGQGVNQYTYYVTTDLCGDWLRLPDIKPKEIIAARGIKRMVTGNPNAKVITHPAFSGSEQVLLRAQIARITADTVLCVKGYLKKQDEEDEASPIEENPEFVSPLPADLMKKEAWCHMQPHILLNGRTTYQDLPDAEVDDGKALAKAMEEREADPPRQLLRDVETDGLRWTIKQAGDATLYGNLSDPTGRPRCSAVVYVRSLSWPGAVCAIRNGQFTNIYVGHGLAAGEPGFFPPAPPDVQDEPEDQADQDEPQGMPEEEAPADD